MPKSEKQLAPQVDRRHALKSTLAVGAGVALGSYLGPLVKYDRANAEAQTVTVEIAAGAVGSCYGKAFHEVFEKETGIKVRTVLENYNDSKFRLAVETRHYVADVMEMESFIAQSPDASKYLEPIDYSVINRDDLVPELAQTYAVATDLYATTLAYNSDKTGGRIPSGWTDFFDLQKFAGKRGVNNTPIATPMVALLADGVAPKDIVPLDFNRAFKKLDTIRDQIVFWDGGSQVQDLLSSGETPLSMTFANRAEMVRREGKPIGQVWSGFILSADMWAIPKGNPNKEAAMKYLAFVLSRKINARLSTCVALGPSNRFSKMDSEWERVLPSSHFDETHVILHSPQVASWIGSHQDEINDRWQRWKAS